MKAKKSMTAYELTLKTYDLHKKYKIDEFKKKFSSAFSPILGGHDHFVDDYIKHPGEFFDSLIEQNPKLPKAKQIELANQYKAICDEHNFDEFMKEGMELHTNFLKQRKEYMASRLKIIGNSNKKHVKSNVFDWIYLERTEDAIFAKWLDATLEKVYPKHLKVKYEDFNGTLTEKVISHQDPVKFHEEGDGAVECKLIPRFSGVGLFDSFLTVGFYDCIHQNWLYIPPRLIIEVRSADDKLIGMDGDGEFHLTADDELDDPDDSQSNNGNDI